jgi:hypothetical protein
MPLKSYDDIRLRHEFQNTLGNPDAINEHRDRTPGKDEVAQYLVDEIIAEGRWPLNMTELAEETGYSRQHVSNVVADYFEGVDESTTPNAQPTSANSSPMSASPRDIGESTNSASTETETTGKPKTVYVRTNDHVQEVQIEVPSDVNQSSYVRGYLDAVESR